MTRNFYVHIVESPSPDELMDGRSEGQALCAFLASARIPYAYFVAVDKVRLRATLTDRIAQAPNNFGGLPPILHISSHGGPDGIQLTHQRDTNEIVRWDELAGLIRPIHLNHADIGGIGVCLSCCNGAHGQRMVEVPIKQDVPFTWLVGKHTTIDVHDAALAYAVFYRRFQTGCNDVDQMVHAMNGAIDSDDFTIVHGESRQEQYTYEQVRRWLATHPPQPSAYGYTPPYPGSAATAASAYGSLYSSLVGPAPGPVSGYGLYDHLLGGQSPGS